MSFSTDLKQFVFHEYTRVHLQVAILLMEHYYSEQFDDIFEQALISLFNEVDDEVEDWSTIQFIAVITLYSISHKSRGQQWIQSGVSNRWGEKVVLYIF